MAKEGNPAAVDTYLDMLADNDRKTLQSLRELIKSEVPGVGERISYGTSVIFSLDRDLVGFVAQPKHLSFFTMSPELAKKMKNEITETHKLSGATIHFTSDKPLPATLVKKIIKARVAENEAKKR
jgi:uncharacterized protein YdhG (YjbR/CyaY superfamily)